MVNLKLTNELAKELNFTEKHLIANALNFLISKEVLEENCVTTLLTNLSTLTHSKEIMHKLLTDKINSSKLVEEWVKAIPPLTTVHEIFNYIKIVNNASVNETKENYIMMMKTISNFFSIIMAAYGHGRFEGTYVDEDGGESVIFSSRPTSLQIMAFHVCEVCKVKTNDNHKFFSSLFRLSHADFKRYERYVGHEVYKELKEHMDYKKFKETFNSNNLDTKFFALMTSVDFVSRNEASCVLVNHNYDEEKKLENEVDSNYSYYDYLLTNNVEGKMGSEIILSRESLESDVLVTHIATLHTKEDILQHRQIIAPHEVGMVNTKDEYDIYTFKETHVTENEVDKHSIHGKITYKGLLHDFVFDIESTRLTAFFATSIPKILAFARYLAVSGITGEVMHPIKTKKTLATYSDVNSLLHNRDKGRPNELEVIYDKVKEHFSSSFYVLITNPQGTLIKIADKKEKNPVQKTIQMDLAVYVNEQETLTTLHKLKIKAEKKEKGGKKNK